MRKTNHTQEVKDRAIELYFDIEKHFALGGNALTFKDISIMLGAKKVNAGLARHYLDILEHWKLIERGHGVTRSIILAPTNYPPVYYKDVQSDTWYGLNSDNSRVIIRNLGTIQEQ